MDKILKGIMRYRCETKEHMVKQFLQVRDNPTVSGTGAISSSYICTRWTKNFLALFGHAQILTFVFLAQSRLFFVHRQQNDPY